MIQIKNIKTFALAILLLLGCDDLEDLNKNPNQPEEVSTDVLLTSAIRSSVTSMVNESFLLGNNAAQLTAKTLRTEVDAYSWNAFPTVWEEMYKSLSNIKDIELQATAQGDNNKLAVAKILKSWIYSVLTLAYGDIPYSEAISGVEKDNWFPAYDAQEDILTDLLNELEEANDFLDGSAETIGGDILFDGTPLQWQKLANSLRLRILMHLSNKVDVSAEFADIVTNMPYITTNTDNAVLTYTGTYPNEFPLMPLKQGDFDAVVLSNNAFFALDSYNDPRLGVYARPVNAAEIAENDTITPIYDGAENGLETGECDKTGSRLGYMYYDIPSHFISARKAEGIIMLYSEVEFLLAEACYKGWISEDTESHYQNGIKASMDYYQAEYTTFGWNDFSDFYSNSGISYSDNLVDIWKQKWLALFFTGLEPYFDVRRWMYESDFDWAGLPFLAPPCLNTNDDKLPIRFLYPGNEQSLNPDNYSLAIEKLGGNSQNSAMWIMK